MARGGGGGGHSGGHSGGFRSGGGGSFGGRGFSGGGFGGGGFSGGSHYSGGNHVYHHYSYGGSPIRYSRSSGGSGCLTSIVTLIILLAVVSILSAMANSAGSSSGTKLVRSTEKREKLASNLCQYNNDWYEDELNWIGRRNGVMISGLEAFYEKTGVQPYVALVKYDADRTMNDEEYAEALYEELFDDEGHMLFCYFACYDDRPYVMDGTWYYVIGRAAEIVMDSEAKAIFESYLNAAYNDLSLDVDEMFSEAFSKSGKAIMRGPVHIRYIVLIIVGIVALVLIILILYKWWKKRTAQKNKEHEDLERILSRPLETFGDRAVDELKDKYK